MLSYSSRAASLSVHKLSMARSSGIPATLLCPFALFGPLRISNRLYTHTSSLSSQNFKSAFSPRCDKATLILSACFLPGTTRRSLPTACPVLHPSPALPPTVGDVLSLPLSVNLFRCPLHFQQILGLHLPGWPAGVVIFNSPNSHHFILDTRVAYVNTYLVTCALKVFFFGHLI